MSIQTSLQAQILNGALVNLNRFFQQAISINDNNQNTDYKQLISTFNTSNDTYAIYDFLRKQINEKQKLSLPFMSLTLDTMSISQESAKNVGATFRMGHYIAANGNEKNPDLYFRTTSIPTIFDCTIKFLTDDFWQLLSFCSMWMVGTQDKAKLNLLATWNNIKFSIKIDLAPSITFPAKDNTLDIVNLYEFNGTLKIHGNISPQTDTTEMIPVAALRTINVETIIVPEGYEILDYSKLDNLQIENFEVEK